MMRLANLIFFLPFFFVNTATAVYTRDTLTFDRNECEALFLQKNLLLIAERLEVPMAEAAVQQARLWPNPTFTLDQVNLWATPGQTGGQEAVPPLFGSLGRNQQFGSEIEQLIPNARKRSRLIALEQVKAEKASQYFEELLRNLKVEFRKNLTELQHLQLSEHIYRSQLASLDQLIRSYQRQVEDGHIPRSEWMRLKALELEILRNLNELHREKNEVQKDLKLWMRLPATAVLVISEEGFDRSTEALSTHTIGQIAEEGRNSRPDLHVAQLDEKLALRQVDYEKAKRNPDVTLKAMYDRNGNTMLNFFGFGASINLPLFDRNQGNIRVAQLGTEQARKRLEYQTEKIENEIILAYQNLVTAIDLASKIEAGYERSLDDLLTAYTRNFSNRNISMLEFLDFMETYRENKKIILDARRSVNDRIEELNYSAGTDLL